MRTPFQGVASFGWSIAVWAVLATGIPARAGDSIASGDTSKKKIAFSNSYAGNSFRQVMIKSFLEMGDQAKKDGLIGDVPVVSANNSVTEQASQIEDLIRKGYDAITILAGSDTGLNSAINNATNAGIAVVAVASGVTEPSAYRVDYDLANYAKAELDYLASRLDKPDANLLEVRGIAGDGFDKRLHDGVLEEMKEHPGFKIVGEV
jgi:ribose transport system substrate-binding protein